MSKDPKKLMGDRKVPLQLLPTIFQKATANALKSGADKYGEYNWRKGHGVEAMTYIGAMRRHLDQFIDGEDFDEESGESHLGHIAAGCAILLDAMRMDKLIDNRPKSLEFMENKELSIENLMIVATKKVERIPEDQCKPPEDEDLEALAEESSADPRILEEMLSDDVRSCFTSSCSNVITRKDTLYCEECLHEIKTAENFDPT